MPAEAAAVTPQRSGTGSAGQALMGIGQSSAAKGSPMRRNTSALLVALVAGLALSACNTVGGAGKDLSSAGKAVTKTANDVKN
jgi:predicted small secreted protein